jgi:tetratricopeptide (TPR) repeat protein
MVYADIKENEKAEEYYYKALELAEDLEDPYYITYLKMKIASLLLQKGDPKKAKKLCKKCLEIFEQLGKTQHFGEFFRIYGIILREMGEWEKAETFFQKSIKESGDSPLELGQTYLEYAAGLKNQGNTKKAKDFYDTAVALFEKVSAKKEIEKAKKRWNSLVQE